jgi:hypothetical protein
MSPARLSNYVPSRRLGPWAGPKFKRVGSAQNLNNTGLFGLGPDRAARMSTYTYDYGWDVSYDYGWDLCDIVSYDYGWYVYCDYGWDICVIVM